MYLCWYHFIPLRLHIFMELEAFNVSVHFLCISCTRSHYFPFLLFHFYNPSYVLIFFPPCIQSFCLTSLYLLIFIYLNFPLYLWPTCCVWFPFHYWHIFLFVYMFAPSNFAMLLPLLGSYLSGCQFDFFVYNHITSSFSDLIMLLISFSKLFLVLFNLYLLGKLHVFFCAFPQILLLLYMVSL